MVGITPAGIRQTEMDSSTYLLSAALRLRIRWARNPSRLTNMKRLARSLLRAPWVMGSLRQHDSKLFNRDYGTIVISDLVGPLMIPNSAFSAITL